MTISHYSRLLFHTVLKPRVNALQCTKLASNWIWKLPLFQLKLLNRSIEISEFTSNIPEYKLNRLTLVLAWVFHPQRVKIYWASQTTPQISWNMLTNVINMTTKTIWRKIYCSFRNLMLFIGSYSGWCNLTKGRCWGICKILSYIASFVSTPLQNSCWSKFAKYI